MTDKASAPSWQRLKLADFGNSADSTHLGMSPVQKPAKAGKPEPASDQAHGFTKGYDDGLAAGRVEGFAAGEAAGMAEGQQAAHQLLSLAASLDRTLTDLNQEIADEVLALALEIAHQVLRQAVATKPDVVLPVVREALGQLPHQHAAIYLHPADAELVRKHAGDQLSHAGHRIHEDPKLRRGDVMIESNGAQVDATLATRWRRIVESLGSTTPWINDEKT